MEKNLVTYIVKDRPINSEHHENLIKQGVHPFLARLWAARGVRNIEQTQTSWQRLLAPSLLSEVETGASLLANAIESRKKLLIVADYDCDGATACAVAVRALRLMGAQVDFLVPNRFETGYGLSPAVIEVIQNKFEPLPDILITVDNGIASVAGVAAANALGMRVIVTDHHLPAEQLPEALAIINPNKNGCSFPSKNLAGVGVIFYTMLALRAEFRQRGRYTEQNQPRLDTLADLVALGTVADVVKLDDNNRILVSQGLAKIRSGQMQAGIQALFTVASSDPRQASTMDLGFKIGPRINAAGRLADMSIGIRCLLTDDMDQALLLAKELDQWNHSRRDIERSMSEQAQAELDQAKHPAEHSICIYNQDWHQGVVGIVASRLKDKFWKPALAFAPGDAGEIRGSGRSVPDVHLRDALDLVSKREPGMILKFGGHAMAAGLTIKEVDFERFAQAFDVAVVDISGKTDFYPLIETDGSLSLHFTNTDNAISLQQQVWGVGFPTPLFRDMFSVLSQRLLKDKHLKLELQRGDQRFSAIWFNHPETLPDYVELVYEMNPNYWNGSVSLQLMIKHAEIIPS